jgi:hypothetical protein
MYTAFEAARGQIPSNHLVEVHYEQLIADPEGTVEKLYSTLGLGDFSKVKSLIAQRFANDREYQVNEHRISPELEAAVLAHWGSYAQRYGYA